MPDQNLPGYDQSTTEQGGKDHHAAKQASDYARPTLHRICSWLKYPRAWVEILALCFVGFYACLTYQLVHNAKLQFAASERPWVGLGINFWLNSDYHLKPSDRALTIPVDLRNAGEGPALHTEPVLLLAFGSYASDIYPWPRNTAPGIDACQGTKSEHKTSLQISAFPRMDYQVDTNSVVVTPQDFTNMTSKQSSLYIVGCISYQDPKGNRYKTDVCLYYSLTSNNSALATGRFKFCPVGNGTTKNHQPE